mmetsp:Transcript_4855/g.12467  ORF Transcript_4855/g.12467 Transcript_4855/m.12467 type:complete len:189 (+) Transcript_4855:80-646(+)
MFKSVKQRFSQSEDVAHKRLLTTVKRTQSTLSAKGWLGTVRVALSFGVVGVHAIAPVGGAVQVVRAHTVQPAEGAPAPADGPAGPTDADGGGEGSATDPGATGATGAVVAATADDSVAAADGTDSAETQKLDSALVHLCTAIEKSAVMWRGHGMGGQVGASVNLSLFGFGLSMSASIDVASVKVDPAS